MNFSAYGFCASLCFCKASTQCYRWLTWVQMVSDTIWMTELAAESIVLLTSTLTQHLLDLGAEEFREWMKLVICFSVLHSHGLGAGTVTQRALVVLRPFFALTHTSSSLSLLCRREVPFHWTLNDTFLFSWRAAEKRRTWVTHNKETHINCIYFF